jgi:Tfp pilus assembly protein PilO
VKDLGKVLLGLAVALLAVALAVVLFVPRPTTNGLAGRLQRDTLRAQIAIKDAKKSSADAEARVKETTWTGDPKQIPPAALAKVSTLATQRGLKLVAFRPQRTNEAGVFRQLPFLVTVEGPYPSITKFCQDIDQPSSRLAVDLIQIASADAASNAVTASVGLVAYVNEDRKEGANGSS